jgi:hypothetical protein
MNSTVGARPPENLGQSVNDLVAEGGHALVDDDKTTPVQRHNWDDDIAHLTPSVRARLMAKYSITYNGRHYEKTDYRYDSLADAVRHAKLQHVSGKTIDDKTMIGPRRRPENVESPTAEPEIQLMARFGITFANGTYTLGSFKYERLSDALDYARLKRQLPV